MTKETAFQTLGISEDASPQQIKQAWRDMLAVWHPDKHMGNERLRRKAEEQSKRINEAYDRIQTGNFKSSNRPQSESPPYEDFRQAHRQAYEDYIRREEEAKAREQKESPPKREEAKVKQKKTSGWVKFWIILIFFKFLILPFLSPKNDEYDKEMPPHDIVHPKPQHDLPKSTETLKERIARWGLQIPPEIYDQPHQFEEHSNNVITAMDDILGDFKSASSDDDKQDALVTARATIATFFPKDHPSGVALEGYNEAQIKQWVRETKRLHTNYLKTGIRNDAESLLEEARRKEADAYQALQEQAAAERSAAAEQAQLQQAAAAEQARRQDLVQTGIPDEPSTHPNWEEYKRYEAAMLEKGWQPMSWEQYKELSRGWEDYLERLRLRDPAAFEEVRRWDEANHQRQVERAAAAAKQSQLQQAAAAEQSRMQAPAQTAIPAEPSNFPTAEDMAFASRRVVEGMTWEQALRMARKNRTETKQ